MVLLVYEDLGDNLVHGTEDEDESDVDDRWGELQVDRNVHLSILFDIWVIPDLHANLGADDGRDEGDRNWNAQEDLSEVGVKAGDFISWFRFSINEIGRFELLTFCGRILEISH